METGIIQAAHFLRNGDHPAAEEVIRTLQKENNYESIECALSVLRGDTSSVEATYVHFVALKLLRFCLIRNHEQWESSKDAIVEFLMTYGNGLGDSVVSPAWRPVVSELTSTIGVVLKLSCIRNGALDTSAVQGVCDGVVSLLTPTCSDQQGSAASYTLGRNIALRVVEEFGLYDVQTRRRGLPVSMHRQCRTFFETSGSLSIIAGAVLRSLTLSLVLETAASAEAGLFALIAVLSWTSHRFFEEDGVADESCDTFVVPVAQWGGFLLGFGDAAGGATCSIFTALEQWYIQGSMGGSPVQRQQLVEIGQLLCSFTCSDWSAEQALRFTTSCATLCLSIFEHVASSRDADLVHLLPGVCNGIQRLVNINVEVFAADTARDLMLRLASVTQGLIRWDSAGGDDESLMSSLDELLSCWYHVASHMGRTSSGEPGIVRDSCASIFSTYLQCRVDVARTGEDEVEEDSLMEAFARSHLQLVANIGRVSSAQACGLLRDSLERVSQRVVANGMSSPQVDDGDRIAEKLWFIFKLSAFLIADPSDGEQPCIPRCFLEAGTRGDEQLLTLMNAFVAFGPMLFSGSVTSPAVFAAYIEVLDSYLRTYVEAEETCQLYTNAFDGGAGLVTFALRSIAVIVERFKFDEDVTSASCAALDAIAEKSSGVHAFVSALPVFSTILEYVVNSHAYQFTGNVRGRLLAFVLMCSVRESPARGAIAGVVEFASRGDSVAGLLEVACTLSGLFASLHQQDVIRDLFPILVQTGEQLLQACSTRFYERAVVIEVLHFVHNMFTACASMLDNASIGKLLALVVAVLQYCSNALHSVSSWHAADGEDDRTRFLISVAKLISSVAQWRALDCFLPDEDIGLLACTAVEVLAEVLSYLDKNALHLPELEEAVFASLEVVAEYLSSTFIASSRSDVFFSAMMYALNSDRSSVQRVGIAVSTSVAAACMQSSDSSPSTYQPICVSLLGVLLRAITFGKVYFFNTRHIAKTIITVSSGLPRDVISESFRAVSTEVPEAQSFLEEVYGALLTSFSGGPPSAERVRTFTLALQDSISSIRGVHVL